VAEVVEADALTNCLGKLAMILPTLLPLLYQFLCLGQH
jgi:hypothetical protein